VAKKENMTETNFTDIGIHEDRKYSVLKKENITD
jgi:hypothetical protein